MRYLFTGMGLEFLMGIFIALVYDEKDRFEIDFGIIAVVFFCLALFGFAAGSISPWFDRVEILRVATFGLFGASSLILFLSLNELRIKAPKFLILIGDASFSIYLIHPFLLDFGGVLAFRLQMSNIELLLYNALLIPFVIIVSVVWYRIIENPLTKIAKRIWSQKFETN